MLDTDRTRKLADDGRTLLLLSGGEWVLRYRIVEATEKLPEGTVNVRYHFDFDGGQPGAGGTGRLYYNDKLVGEGRITKTGNTHARRTLIESAQAYRLPARKSPTIRKRKEGLSEDVLDIAWNAQLRLCHRYRRLIAKGKKHNVVVTAIARELVGFIWAIARIVPLAA